MLMKSFLTFFALAFTALSAIAKDGYRIQVKFTDRNLKDSMVYLAHYFGKPLPTIYKADSARFDKNGVAVLKSDKQTLGGIYMLLLQDHQTYVEFLLNNGDDFAMTVNSSKLPTGVEFKGSQENVQFLRYVNFLQDFGKRQGALQSELAAAKTKADTAKVQAKGASEGKELIAFRRNLAAENKGTLLASIFYALEVPQVPEEWPKTSDGKKDSTFPYTYYKEHYWDGFNFKDERLIHTPIYDAKLDEYFNKLVLPYPDSVEKEADWLLAQTRGQKELFKYTLWWITRNVENSKVMGMDQVFVHLAEKYYMKGDAYWLDAEALKKYIEHAQKIAPNVVGNLAPEIIMTGMDGGQKKLSEVNGKYTLLVFWTHTCGHCTEEIPRVDSVYKAVLKDKGVKVYSVRTEGDEAAWRKFVKEKNLGADWIHVYDPERRSDFRAKYNVYTTPVIYLLDEKKIIRGKKLDHSNILSVIEMLEKKNKSAATN